MMTSNRVELSLKNFYVYNVSYGQKEGEEEKKILYYYPKGTNIDIQIKDVGLSEAIVKFASTFSKDPCDALLTEKTRRVFIEPEPNFWMVLTLNVPCSKLGRDGMDGTVYHGDEIQNSVFIGVLRQTYATAKLFIGPFQLVIQNNNGDTTILQRKLDSFLTKYLMSIVVKNCGMNYIFRGLQFMPLDKSSFLSALSFVNSVEANHPQVEYSMLLFHDNLVWSSLSAEDSQLVYRYIVDSMLPSFLKQEGVAEKAVKQLHPPEARFVAGPRNVNDISFSGRLPKVWLSSSPKPAFYSLTVYRHLTTTLCWLISDEESLSADLFRSLDAACRAELPSVEDDMLLTSGSSGAAPSSKQLSQINTDGMTFLYFNKANRAVKEIHSALYPSCLLPLIVDTHDTHSRLLEDCTSSCETVSKTLTDLWVVGRLSNLRHLYITLNKKKTLLDVNDEVNKICEKQLKGIYFHI